MIEGLSFDKRRRRWISGSVCVVRRQPELITVSVSQRRRMCSVQETVARRPKLHVLHRIRWTRWCCASFLRTAANITCLYLLWDSSIALKKHLRRVKLGFFLPNGAFGAKTWEEMWRRRITWLWKIPEKRLRLFCGEISPPLKNSVWLGELRIRSCFCLFVLVN